MSLHGQVAHFLLALNDIPLSGDATIYLSLHLLKDSSCFQVLAWMNKCKANFAGKSLKIFSSLKDSNSADCQILAHFEEIVYYYSPFVSISF